VPFDDLRGVLPETADVTPQGHLRVGGCDLVELADEFGTPLYVYDEAAVRGRAREYREALKDGYPGEARVCYAAKAYCAPWLLRVIAEEQLGLDVVSGGELYAAQVSEFPLERVYFHGNNKSPDELAMAVQAGVHRVVVDNLEEIDRLKELGSRQAVLLRVAPGVEAHTHEHIKTGVLDTKFGLSIQTGAAAEAVRALRGTSLQLVGLHAHIGSQIFELEPYRETISRVIAFAAEVGLELRELSPGGGFGMRYIAEDDPLPVRDVVQAIARAVCEAAAAHSLQLPGITIEPGRSIIGPSAVAVYRVGSIKDVPGVRTYVAVDGGMADNMRPATYAARYSALLANRATDGADATVAVAGRYCESGDVLIRAAKLPMPRLGDLVAIPGSGAYHLSMASNYNLVPRPAVVAVKDGQARLVRRRETYADLLSNELTVPPSRP
jgi:diaminopimelate decarboxylase